MVSFTLLASIVFNKQLPDVISFLNTNQLSPESIDLMVWMAFQYRKYDIFIYMQQKYKLSVETLQYIFDSSYEQPNLEQMKSICKCIPHCYLYIKKGEKEETFKCNCSLTPEILKKVII
jgi:hypothetical protein